MAGKRKRRRQDAVKDQDSKKRRKVSDDYQPASNPIATRLLPFYYPRVSTLRNHLLNQQNVDWSALQKRLASLDDGDRDVNRILDTTLVGSFGTQLVERQRHAFLRDFQEFEQKLPGSAPSDKRLNDGAITSMLGHGSLTLSELVNFVVWSLFHRRYRYAQRPPHLLCHGFQRAEKPRVLNNDYTQSIVDGLMAASCNSYVETLKGGAWKRLFELLGGEGNFTFLNLLLDCGIFIPIDENENFLQLSGVSLGELPLLNGGSAGQQFQSRPPGTQLQGKAAPPIRSPAAICFVRSRMLYARAALNAKGEVHFGLRHIHALNRFPNSSETEQTKHVMKYIFPRQFNLHNVFTSTVDRKETSHAFKDYTLREQEISTATRQGESSPSTKIPKRLRSRCFDLVQKLQKLQKRCAYRELIKHYCPVDFIDAPRRRSKRHSNTPSGFDSQYPSSQKASSKNKKGMSSQKNLVDASTPVAHVSAFARAVLYQILPHEFLGKGSEGKANISLLMTSVHHFISAKRFEGMSLEAVCKGVKLNHIQWLQPATIAASAKMSLSDFQKRNELLHELLYYVFDSMLIPLLRANFYVTDSNEHKYRLFYFRHDVWRLITEPALSRIRTNMYQEISPEKAREILGSRSLGYSRVRLLPKKVAVRPIINLKRRAMIKRFGKTYLTPSINSTLKNVFRMLKCEKDNAPALVGSSIFSVSELYPRLTKFRSILKSNGLDQSQLYFIKVDAQSCFDTIPQQAVVDLIERVCATDEYAVKHHVETKAASPFSNGTSKQASSSRPTRKFLALAHTLDSSQDTRFAELAGTSFAKGKQGTVFSESNFQSRVSTEDMLDLLDDHVLRNIVRIGKKFYRQKSGIPQGSVLSSLLCSIFYGDFEAKCLGFLSSPTFGASSHATVLIRLIDDFLLITTDKTRAERFLQTMIKGNPEYGITVRPEKTLLNFLPGASDAKGRNAKWSTPTLSQKVEQALPRIAKDASFPWCGVLINTSSLAVSRDRSTTQASSSSPLSPHGAAALRKRPWDLADSTTLEPHRRAGAAFHRKMLAALRVNVRDVYADTSVAPRADVARELLAGLTEVAERAARYLARLRGAIPRGWQRSRSRALEDAVVIKTIEDIANVSVALTGSRRNRPRRYEAERHEGAVTAAAVPSDVPYGSRDGGQGRHCSVTAAEIQWLTATAFINVFKPQQTKYRGVLTWLAGWKKRLEENGQWNAHFSRIMLAPSR